MGSWILRRLTWVWRRVGSDMILVSRHGLRGKVARSRKYFSLYQFHGFEVRRGCHAWSSHERSEPMIMNTSTRLSCKIRAVGDTFVSYYLY